MLQCFTVMALGPWLESLSMAATGPNPAVTPVPLAVPYTALVDDNVIIFQEENVKRSLCTVCQNLSHSAI